MKPLKTVIVALPITVLLVFGFSLPSFSKDLKGYCCINGQVVPGYQSKCGKHFYPSKEKAEYACKPKKTHSFSSSSKSSKPIVDSSVKAFCCENGNIVKRKMTLKALKASETCSTDSKKIEEFCGFCCKNGKVSSISSSDEKKKSCVAGQLYGEKSLAERNCGWCCQNGKVHSVAKLSQCRTRKLYSTQGEADDACKAKEKEGFCIAKDGKRILPDLTLQQCEKREKGNFFRTRALAQIALLKNEKKRKFRKENKISVSDQPGLLREQLTRAQPDLVPTRLWTDASTCRLWSEWENQGVAAPEKTFTERYTLNGHFRHGDTEMTSYTFDSRNGYAIPAGYKINSGVTDLYEIFILGPTTVEFTVDGTDVHDEKDEDNNTMKKQVNCLKKVGISPGFMKEMKKPVISSFAFIHPHSGEMFSSTTPLFTWHAHFAADKYFIRIMKNDGSGPGSHRTIWEQDNIPGTSIVYNSDGSADEPLVLGQSYRTNLYARSGSQTGTPDTDPTGFLQMTGDVTFTIAPGLPDRPFLDRKRFGVPKIKPMPKELKVQKQISTEKRLVAFPESRMRIGRAKSPGDENGLDVIEPRQGHYQTKGFPLSFRWRVTGTGCDPARDYTVRLRSDWPSVDFPLTGCTVGGGSSATECGIPDETPDGDHYYVRVSQGDECWGESWLFSIGGIRDAGAGPGDPEPGTIEAEVRRPSLGDVVNLGDRLDIVWRVLPTEWYALVDWQVQILQNGAAVSDPRYNMSFSETHRPDFNTTTRRYSTSWDVPDDADTTGRYAVRVMTTDNPIGGGTISAVSGNFTISTGPVEFLADIYVAPLSGSGVVYITSPKTINYNAVGLGHPLGDVRIKLMQAGAEVKTLSESTSGGAFAWKVGTNHGSSTCCDDSLVMARIGTSARPHRIRVESIDDPRVFGESEEFTFAAPEITDVQIASGASSVPCSSSQTITWLDITYWGPVVIELRRASTGGLEQIISATSRDIVSRFEWDTWLCPGGTFVHEDGGSLGTVPYNTDLRIRVRSVDCPDVYGESQIFQVRD